MSKATSRFVSALLGFGLFSALAQAAPEQSGGATNTTSNSSKPPATVEPTPQDEVITNTTTTITNTTTAKKKVGVAPPSKEPKLTGYEVVRWRLHHTELKPADVEALLKSHFPADDQTKLPVIKKYDQGISVQATDDEIRKILFFVATRIDVPPAQVRLSTWTIQMNANLDDYEGTQNKLDTIHAGLNLTREYNKFIQKVLSGVCRKLENHPNKEKKKYDLKDPNELLKGMALLGFSKETDRLLSLFDIFIFFCVSDRCTLQEELKAADSKLVEFLQERERRLRAALATVRTCGEKESLESLISLVQQWQKRTSLETLIEVFATDDPACVAPPSFQSHQAVSLRDMTVAYALAYLGKNADKLEKANEAAGNNAIAESSGLTQNDLGQILPPHWQKQITEQVKQSRALDQVPTTGSASSEPPRRFYPQRLQQRLLETDSLLRSICESYALQMEVSLWGPYVNWARALCAETDELNVLGHQEVTVNSGQESQAIINATSYHPFVLRRDAEGEVKNEAQGVIEGLAAGVNLYPAIAGPLFSIPPEPTFVSVAPGANLKVTPTMRPGGAEAHLNISLTHSTNATVEEELQKRGIAPVALVNSSSYNTKVWITTYDMFLLATQTLQTSRKGGPDWAIPILRDLPLIGYLFKGPDRPHIRNQGLVVLTQALVIPRTLDLVYDQ